MAWIETLYTSNIKKSVDVKDDDDDDDDDGDDDGDDDDDGDGDDDDGENDDNYDDDDNIYGDARFISVQMNKLFHRFSNSFKTTERLADYRRLSWPPTQTSLGLRREFLPPRTSAWRRSVWRRPKNVCVGG